MLFEMGPHLKKLTHVIGKHYYNESVVIIQCHRSN